LQYYFQLQFKRAIRFTEQIGLPKALAAILLVLGFLFASHILFYKLASAVHIYALLGVYATIANATPDRMQLLSMLFDQKKKQFIKLTESLLITIPFVGFLCFKGAFIHAAAVVLLALIFSLFDRKRLNAIIIPTPFGSQPFEFIIGFRKNWLFILLAFGVVIIAIAVGNANLGLVVFGINFLVPIAFYGIPEEEFYVWNHAKSAVTFLNQKLVVGLQHSLILNGPLALLLIVFFHELWWVVLIILALGMMVLALGILSKYAYYPNMPELFQGMLVVGSLAFPPLGLVLLPIIYRKAASNLNILLC
jgi:hypothetical protein